MEISQALLFIGLNAIMISFIVLSLSFKVFNFVFMLISSLFTFIITAFLFSNPVLPSLFNAFVILLYLILSLSQVVYSIYLIKGD